jgi:predicted nucleic acid-binding protein
LNVVLDVLLDRQPHAGMASALWAAGERRSCQLTLAAHGLTTIFYLVSRQRDRQTAKRVVADLASVFEIAPVDEEAVRRALAMELPDFEDAVTAAAAERTGCDAVVTRNLDDFEGSPIPAIDAATALAWLETSA